MKILIQRNNKQKLASKIAAASFIKQGIPANDILFLEFENNALLNSKIGKKYLREGKIRIFKNDLQSFTLLRFYGPEFVHYKEKILIIDPDVFAIKNPKNISYFLDDNNSLACTFINHEPRTEVMLVNAEKVKWKFNEIVEVRGAGLLLGIKTKTNNFKISELFAAKGLLTVPADDNVVRLMPPLIITNDEIDQAIEIIKKVLQDING